MPFASVSIDSQAPLETLEQQSGLSECYTLQLQHKMANLRVRCQVVVKLQTTRCAINSHTSGTGAKVIRDFVGDAAYHPVFSGNSALLQVSSSQRLNKG